MKYLSLILGGLIAATASSAVASEPINELSTTLYLESTQSVTLYASTQLEDGQTVLKSQIKIPAESLLSVDVEYINAALNLSKNNPDRIAYPLINPRTKAIEKSKDGWVCGFDIVDIMDEDLRNSEVAERNDFCISLSDLKKMDAIDSNEKPVIESFYDFAINGDLTRLNELSTKIEEVRQEMDQFGSIEKMALAPLISPLKNCNTGCLVATSEYGMRKHPVLGTLRLHKGIDLRASVGAPVVSVLSGKILATRTERSRLTRQMKGYGNYVIVVHPNSGMETLYAHLSQFKTKAGKTVKQGELIALSGNTGIGTAPHLHFETHMQTKGVFKTVNPRKFLSTLLASVLEFFSFQV